MSDKLKRAVIKEELVELTGDFKKAVILNQLIYWSERVDDFDDFIKEENKRKDREEEIEKRNGWIFKSSKKLSNETMLGMAPTTIRKHIKKLSGNGWVNERNNPNYHWDHTKQYRVNINKIRRDLSKLGYTLDNYENIDEDRTSKNEVRGSENEERGKESEDRREDSEEQYHRLHTENTKENTNKDIDNSDEEKKEKLREVFDHWVRQESTVSHRKFKDSHKSAINARLDDGFTVDEIKEAISNYDKANRAKNSYWNYDAWSLKQFLSRDSGGHVETFLEKPKTYIEDDSGEFKFGGDEEGRKTKVKDGVEYIYTNEWGWVPKEEDKDD